jgi:sugar phosphate isomerase/epimerase
MIRQPLGVRLETTDMLREQIRMAATLGAKGVVLDATGDLNPDRLGETGRREIRHLLRSVELTLIALHLPTRSPFDSLDNLADRVKRADSAFALAYELGTRLVLVRVGGVPGEEETNRRTIMHTSLSELSRHADHRGIRIALETGLEPGLLLRGMLESVNSPSLAASIDPAALLTRGIDPITTTRDLSTWVAHAYANDAATGVRTSRIANPRGIGFPPGALDWEEYLGALEEINYHGFLTAWPEPGGLATQFPELRERLRRF